MPKLSFHAKKRNVRRTKVGNSEILNLITRGIHIDLGENNGYTYILLYIPTEQRSKIIVMDTEKITVVSIWRDTYKVPKGIRKVSHRMKSRVRTQYFDANPFK